MNFVSKPASQSVSQSVSQSILLPVFSGKTCVIFLRMVYSRSYYKEIWLLSRVNLKWPLSITCMDVMQQIEVHCMLMKSPDWSGTVIYWH